MSFHRPGVTLIWTTFLRKKDWRHVIFYSKTHLAAMCLTSSLRRWCSQHWAGAATKELSGNVAKMGFYCPISSWHKYSWRPSSTHPPTHPKKVPSCVRETVLGGLSARAHVHKCKEEVDCKFECTDDTVTTKLWGKAFHWVVGAAGCFPWSDLILSNPLLFPSSLFLPWSDQRERERKKALSSMSKKWMIFFSLRSSATLATWLPSQPTFQWRLKK